MHLRAGAGSDRGRVRTLNEDAYMLRAGDGLFLVCDGMGGAPAGEVASQMAVDAIARQLQAEPAASEANRSEYLPHTTRLAAAVRWSNAFIYDHAQKDPSQSGMGTTVVGAWIDEHVASVAHVGDSRAYLWRGNQLEPLPSPLVEFRLLAVARCQRIDFVFGSREAQRKPFLPLAAEFGEAMRGRSVIGRKFVGHPVGFSEIVGGHRAGLFPEFAHHGRARIFVRVDAALRHLPHMCCVDMFGPVCSPSDENQSGAVEHHHAGTRAIGQ